MMSEGYTYLPRKDKGRAKQAGADELLHDTPRLVKLLGVAHNGGNRDLFGRTEGISCKI